MLGYKTAAATAPSAHPALFQQTAIGSEPRARSATCAKSAPIKIVGKRKTLAATNNSETKTAPVESPNRSRKKSNIPTENFEAQSETKIAAAKSVTRIGVVIFNFAPAA